MLQTLTLDQMRTFVAVAEAGSFRAAAARVSRVQSAVSHAIANLETELGVALFDRTGHRPALTVEGRALLEDARAILLRVDRLRARSRGFSEGVEIVLSLVADGLFPIDRLTTALKRMHEQFPSVSVRLAIEPLGAPLSALQEHRADLAIIVGEEFRVPEVELEVLARVPMLAVVTADHPLAAQADHVAVADLASHLQVVLEDPTALTRGRDIGVLSPETWRVRSQAAKHALILAGVGWGRLPLWEIGRDLDRGRLVRLNAPALGQYGATPLTAFLAWRGDQALGPAARAVRDSLRSESLSPGSTSD
jgi:DNA-binding transcriptional LysR family regulator